MSSKKQRGNPKFLVKRAEQNHKAILKPHEAAHLVDKNSRTIAKILQLLEIIQLPGAAAQDKHGLVMHRVEQLKRRLNRRLIRLAKWADLPQDERQPKDKLLALRPIVPAGYGTAQPTSVAAIRPSIPVNSAPAPQSIAPVSSAVVAPVSQVVQATPPTPPVVESSPSPLEGAAPVEPVAMVSAPETISAPTQAPVQQSQPAAMIGGDPTTLTREMLQSTQAAAMQLAMESLKSAEQ